MFAPSEDGIAQMKSAIRDKKTAVSTLPDAFWREHFMSVLESLEFSIECNRKMPYEYVTRLSSGFDRLIGSSADGSDAERAEIVAHRLSEVPAVLEGIESLLEKAGDLGRSQVADLLPPLVRNVAKAVAFVEKHSTGAAMKADAKKHGELASKVANRLLGKVKSRHVASLDVVDIPFEFSLEKGMQAPLDYVLSWCEEDVEMRRKEFFRVAKEIDPHADPYDLLNSASPRYSTVDELLADMRRILKDIRQSALNFIDLPENESCDVGLIPETWRMVCPTFMYMGDSVCVNPDNLPAFSRAGTEETLAHEVYPGHHAARVKSEQNDLPHTFNLDLFMSRCLQEGIAHRSEYLMVPYFKDPIAKLESARRGWYCATRVKVEVDLYHRRKPVQEVVDNYVKNLNCTVYSAEGQTRAHMMRPADGVSYYTGMRFIEDLYKRSGAGMKDFTNEVFSYGNVALKTMKNIIELNPEKKAQLKAFRPLKA